MAKQKLVTQKEYAAHLGLSQQAVSKMINNGRIPTVHGRIDVKAADLVLAAVSDDSDIRPLAESRRKHLHKLKPAEKEHCKYFVDHGGRALTHNLANGAIQSLLVKGILISPVQRWSNGNFDFNIQPWALEYLRKHPDLLN